MSKIDFTKGILTNINKLDALKNTEFEITNIKLKDIKRSEKNFYELSSIDELAESIKSSNLLHNIVVRDLGKSKYELISGERRYLAYKRLVEKGEAAYKTIPCKVINATDIEAEILLIAGNAYARELSDKEKLLQIEKLERLFIENKEENKTGTKDIQKQISSVLQMSKSAVGRYQNINKNLIPELKEKINEGSLTVTNANIFASLDESKQQIVNEITSENKLSKMQAQDLREKLEDIETYDLDIETIKSEFTTNKSNLIHVKEVDLQDKLKKINKMIKTLVNDLDKKAIVNKEEGIELLDEIEENTKMLINKLI